MILDPFFFPGEIVEVHKNASSFTEYAITDRRFLCMVSRDGKYQVCSIAWDKVSAVQVSPPKITLLKSVVIFASNFECEVTFGHQDYATEFYQLILKKIM